MNQASTGAALWLRFIFRWIIRPLLSIVLGIIVVAAVGVVVAERVVFTTLLNAEFYTGIIAEHDTYNRIYDEVLVDEKVREASEEHLRVELVSHDDLVMILRAVATPEYLREQVESGINDIVNYVRGDVIRLQIYVELGPVLERVKPVLVAYIQGRIDRIPEDPPEDSNCTPGGVNQLAERYSDLHREIAAGRTPASIPSLEALAKPCRILIFDAAYGASEIATLIGRDDFLSQIGLDTRVVEGLQDLREEIRTEIVAGNAKGALKAAVPALVLPVVDDEVERFRAEWLDEGDRLEIIGFLAAQNGRTAANEFRANMDLFRAVLLEAKNLARTWGMVLLIAGSLLMLVINLPGLSGGMRWLGSSLTIAGALYFSGAKILQSMITDWTARMMEEVTAREADFPLSLTELASDLLESGAHQLVDGVASTSLIFMIAGAAVFAASYLVPLGRRIVSRSGE